MAGWNGLVGQTLPPQHRAAAWGVVMATEALGYSLGPLLGGALWASGGVRVFWLGSGVFLLAQLYYWFSGARRSASAARCRSGRGVAQLALVSSTCAALRARSSRQARATTCTPIGRPAALSPTRTDTAGRPARL